MLNPLIDILPTQNAHDFYGIAINAVIDTVHTTHATPVAFADIVNGLIQIGLLRQLLESIKKSVVILVGQRLAIITNAASVDTSQVRFSVFADPIIRHCAAFLP